MYLRPPPSIALLSPPPLSPRYNSIDTYGLVPIVVMIYILLVSFGGFFVMELFLAVIWDEYQNASEGIEEEEAAEEAAEAAEELAASFLFKASGETPVLKEPSRMQKIYSSKACLCHNVLLKKFVTKNSFDMAITFIIVLNTLTMSMEYHLPEGGMSELYQYVLEVSGVVFSGIFFLECILKLFGLGLKEYFADNYNVFDFIIVAFTGAEWIATPPLSGGDASGLSVLRAFRLFRIFKLARSWVTLRVLITKIFKALIGVSSASILLLVIMFIFALLGCQFFAGEFDAGNFGGSGDGSDDDNSESKPRAHFDTIWWSLVTVFQVLTGENWNEVIFNGMHVQPVFSVFYFIILTLLGNYMVLNLFVTILLQVWEDDDDDDDEVHGSLADALDRKPFARAEGDEGKGEGEGGAVGAIKDGTLEIMPATHSGSAGGGTAAKRLVTFEEGKAGPPVGGGGSSKGAPLPMVDPNAMPPPVAGHREAIEDRKMLFSARQLIGDAGAQKIRDAADRKGQGMMERMSSRRKMEKTGKPRKMVELNSRSLFVLGANNPFRIICGRIISHPAFENLILTLIGLSSILLAIDQPYLEGCKGLKPDQFGYDASCVTFAMVLKGLDQTITVLFFFEFFFKVTALGFALHPGAYLRNPWNQLDFFIVVVSLFSWILEGIPALKALRSLRALRALRPLRVVSRFPAMKMVVNAIFRAVPSMWNLITVCFLFFLIFGILGVQTWMGKLNFCNDGDKLYKHNCTGNYTISGADCSKMPTPEGEAACVVDRFGNGTLVDRHWGSLPQNFDHIGNAMLLIFEVSSGEMWPDIMYTVVDSTGIDLPPKFENDVVFPAVYFMIVTVFCSFVLIGLFVMVVVDKFQEIKEENGAALLTPMQKLWVSKMKQAWTTSPIRPPDVGPQGWRRPIFKAVTHTIFETGIMVLIFLNVLFMCMRHYNQGVVMDSFLETSNLIFTIAFTVEAVVKLVGLGPCSYFRAGWNNFDVFLVILSWIDFLVDLGSVATLFRIFRAARLFRLIRSSDGLNDLLQCLVTSTPQMMNVFAIQFILHFVYAVMGMNLFANVRRGDNLSDHANFSSFAMAMLTLFRMSTGESFNGIMHDAMIQVRVL